MQGNRSKAARTAPATIPVPRSRGRTRELRILNSIAEALNSSPDVGRALERTLGLVADLLGLRTGWIWLLDPDTRQFYSAAAQNLPPYLQEPVRMSGRIVCHCIENFQNGKLTPKNINVMECSRLRPPVQANDTGATRGLRCHASIPLYFRDRPLGIMNVTGPEWRELTNDELRLLSTIAYQVGIAIERARLAEESTRLARAEERTRLAREIHDTLAQGLTGIALQIEAALHSMESDPERARERLRYALEATRENLQEARRSVLDLRAAPLATKPLADALGALSRAFTSETGVPVTTRLNRTRELPFRTEAELFRITQEALTNVRKHSGATAVTLTLHAKGALVRLAIRDNGRGFDPSSLPESCCGVRGMRERARVLGGSLHISRPRGRGTMVTAIVPLPSADPP